MKKLILVASALSLASLSYAGAGCGGGSCSGEKKAAPTQQPAEKGADTQKSS